MENSSQQEAKAGAKTPLMKQYYSIKAKYPDAILLFRVGDFYETFSDDAIKTSSILGITLTRKGKGEMSAVELAGFPYHALDTYLPKLVRAGQRVAICEQLEDPKTVKTLVKRGITELITPGISLNDNVLENKTNNFACCINLCRGVGGVSFIDISTGDFFVTEGKIDYIDKLLSAFQPKEVLFERSKKEEILALFGNKYYIYPLEDWCFEAGTARERLLRHFDTNSLKGFGVEELSMGITASGAILHYLDLTQHSKLDHIVKLSRIDEGEHVWIDRFTARNLEIFVSLAGQGQGKSLIEIIDRTSSPQGGRMLKQWIGLPLKNIAQINQRLNLVEAFKNSGELLDNICQNLQLFGDLERLASKISVSRINPREMIMLATALDCANNIKTLLQQSNNPIFEPLASQINPLTEVRDQILATIKEDPPATILKGNFINQGVNSQLDELRDLSKNSKDYLAKLRDTQAEITGISSLKIGFNNVFGYYLEVRNTYKDNVPESWIRKQTLTDAERYITPELKEYEDKILNAEEKILSIEQGIFTDLINYLGQYMSTFLFDAKQIATIDCLCSYAIIASEYNYCKPIINDSLSLKIKQGRHPVIERNLPIGQQYVPNDISLDNQDTQIIMITGPNMAGKSALLRQTALIMILAQAGSFVPCDALEAGYIDKIFTRIGASDNISQGESTFMVEMNEAAGIINNLTERSLVLFDELGRGTSTYDGISIARAIVEYIHEYPTKSKTLFATHYHELNEMQDEYKRIKNFNVSVKEQNGKVIFMRKLVEGGSEHSFGIHVAKLAGMPPAVVERANQIMKELEGGQRSAQTPKQKTSKSKNADGLQLSFFQLDDPVLSQVRDEIAKLDINNLSPLEALNKLNEIKRLCGL